MLSNDNGKTTWTYARFVLIRWTCYTSPESIMEWNME